DRCPFAATVSSRNRSPLLWFSCLPFRCGAPPVTRLPRHELPACLCHSQSTQSARFSPLQLSKLWRSFISFCLRFSQPVCPPKRLQRLVALSSTCRRDV